MANEGQSQLIKLYQAAKSYNPDIKRVKLEMDRQKARVNELKAAFYPQLSLQGVYFYGNTPLRSEIGQTGLDRIDNQNAISLRTTLYNGGAEYTYFKYKEILPTLAKYQENSQLFTFFLQLSALYYNYRNHKNQELLLKKQLSGLKKRVSLLKKWSAIGRVRKADYLSTLTQFKALEGRLQEIIQNKNVAKLNLKAVSGQDVSSLDKKEDFSVYYSLPSIWKQTYQLRPEYKLLEASIQNQLQNITIQEAGLKPRVDFNSNYYINRRQFGRQDDWDVSISLSWNFFDFGATSHRVKQEKVRLYQLQSELKMTQINLDNQIRVFETEYQNQLRRKELLKDSYQVSRQNYNEQSKEFKNGLIDALDLNRALEQLIQAEMAYESMNYSLAEQWHSLKLISGEIKL
jgi:outer membrane protein TolC